MAWISPAPCSIAWPSTSMSANSHGGTRHPPKNERLFRGFHANASLSCPGGRGRAWGILALWVPILFGSRGHGLGYVRLLSILALLPLTLAGCRDESPVHNAHFEAFGAPVDLSIVGIKRDEAERVSRLVEEDLRFMADAWGDPDQGCLGRVNQLLPTAKAFAAPPALLPLIRASQDLAERSGHLFNPALGKLNALWGFQAVTSGRRQPPDKASIEALVKAKPLMSDLQVDDILLRTGNADLRLDFGAIQTGYAIDRVIEHLQELGIHNAILTIGGDLRAIGTRSGQPWPVAVRNPSGGGVLGIIQVSGNESVFTAGDYERNFTYKGKSYHHILDPRTGWPASGARLVTVLHDDATTADVAAHALLIAGPERWYETARALGVRSVLLVDAQGRIHLDPTMARRVELLDRNAEVIEAQPLTPGGASLPGP